MFVPAWPDTGKRQLERQTGATSNDVALRHLAKRKFDGEWSRERDRGSVCEGAEELAGPIGKRVVGERSQRQALDAAKRAEDDRLGKQQQVSAGEVVRIDRGI